MDKFSPYKRIITFTLILSSSLSFAGGSLDLNVGRTLCDT